MSLIYLKSNPQELLVEAPFDELNPGWGIP